MKPYYGSSNAYTVCRAFHYVLLGLTALFAASLKISSDWYVNSVGISEVNITKYINYAPFFIFGGTALAVIMRVCSKKIGQPAINETICYILTHMYELGFQGRVQASQPDYYHRVTLFRAVGYKILPWLPRNKMTWLIAHERTGHTTRDRPSSFRISDDPNKVEGIAGMTWACNGIISKYDLPELSNVSGDSIIRRYAKNTFVTTQRVREHLNSTSKARSLCGIPVEVKGRLWGVLVLDSRDKEEIKGSEISMRFAKILGKLLEGVA